MLVLSRKARQAILIGDKIRVTVLGTQGDKVRLGIDAPKGVVVDRQEVYEKRMISPRRDADRKPDELVG